MRKIKSLSLLILLSLINLSVLAQQSGSIHGEVVDSLGGVIAGATVVAVDASNKQNLVMTNKQGKFVINALVPGKYKVRVVALNFDVHENPNVEVKIDESPDLTIVLGVKTIKEEVLVNSNTTISVESDNNLSATVLKGNDLETLPDNPAA